jgi:hypothetical protein
MKGRYREMSKCKLIVLVMTLAVLSWGIAAPGISAASDTGNAEPAVIGAQPDAAAAAQRALEQKAARLQMRRDAQQYIRDTLNARQSQVAPPAGALVPAGNGGTK